MIFHLPGNDCSVIVSNADCAVFLVLVEAGLHADHAERFELLSYGLHCFSSIGREVQMGRSFQLSSLLGQLLFSMLGHSERARRPGPMRASATMACDCFALSQFQRVAGLVLRRRLGFGFLATKVGLQYAPPFTFLSLRFAFGLLLVVPITLVVRPRWPESARNGCTWRSPAC